MNVDIKELRRLARNATQGPWVRVFSDKTAVRQFKTISGGDVTWVSDCLCPATGLSERVAAKHIDEYGNSHFADIDANHWRAGSDAAFIAAANPATVLALLDEMDALKETMRHMRAELERLRPIESAALNLAKVKGRHHSELAMNQLLEALK